MKTSKIHIHKFESTIGEYHYFDGVSNINKSIERKEYLIAKLLSKHFKEEFVPYKIINNFIILVP